jgi:hypothetical protein
MLNRLTVSFTAEESEALERMSMEDFRPPKDQIRWLLREEAQRRGLLSKEVAEASDTPSAMSASSGCR